MGVVTFCLPDYRSVFAVK